LEEKIEILPVSLLEKESSRVVELKDLAHRLNLEFGWHYLLDLPWILSQLETIAGRRIMDAGAGIGVMQWYLAQHGAQVISVDRDSRAHLPARFRRMFQVEGLRAEDLSPVDQIPARDQQNRTRLLKSAVIHIKAAGINILSFKSSSRAQGKVLLYNQDLKQLVDIPDDSLDAVVAVSSLEHNSPNDLKLVVAELMRVLKPGSPLLATLGAAKDEDWFHQPSKGWCYGEGSLRRAFGFSGGVPSNYADYDGLMMDLTNCKILRENLASFYFRSGENGMPWGVWNPQYQPVGVCKIKRHG
jgi:SAM-dependent methyltransferase